MSFKHHTSSNIPEGIHWWSQHVMDSSSAQTTSPHKFTSSSSQYSNSNFNNFNLNQTMSNEEDNEEHSITMEEQTNYHNTTTCSTNNNEQRAIPKEPLFEKPLTPSDVGKLNRLVIPKQHAEKYFPLNGTDSGGDQKGLLLSFEDESGKCWRFRYSYWNSSQSYVLTKGWSRFVKEKRLDAGDVVLFFRHRVDGGRMFIGWRRKGGARPNSAGSNWGGTVCYPGDGGGGGSRAAYSNITHTGRPVVAPNQTSTVNHTKRLRLFGVNLEYEPADNDRSEPSTPVGSPMYTTSHGQAHHQHIPSTSNNQQYYYYYYPNNNNNNSYTVRQIFD